MHYILLILFTLSLLFLPSLHELSSSSLDNNLSTVDVHKSNDHCNYILVAPKKIINPYKSDITNFVPQKPFGSIYLKCAACLAVAYQIGRTVENITTKLESNQISQDTVNKDISKRINELCVQGFKNYDLRKYNEYSLVTNKFKCTEHIKSNMDGGWTKKLRELCNLYTSHMDLEHISNIYVNNTRELSTHLCKGTGIFRDCGNLEEGLPNDLEEQLCEKCQCK